MTTIDPIELYAKNLAAERAERAERESRFPPLRLGKVILPKVTQLFASRQEAHMHLMNLFCEADRELRAKGIKVSDKKFNRIFKEWWYYWQMYAGKD